MEKITRLPTYFFIVGMCSIVYANILGGLVTSVGEILGNGETYSKCPGVLPHYIVHCVPTYIYNKPCVGYNRKGKLLPPCVDNSDHDHNSDRKRYGSERNINTNTNNVTNTIVIRINDEKRVQVEEKPPGRV